MRDIHQRARQGIRVLLGRHVVRLLIALVGGIVIARVLGPGPIGVFGIGLFVLTLFSLAADLGMRTALIRQSHTPDETELRTCFTVKQILSTILAVVLFVAAPAIANVYATAAAELALVIRILAIDLYVESWRMMSEVRLERELRYRAFAMADISGTAANQLVAIPLVLAGWGAQSLAWGLLAGSLVRTALLYRAAPWPVRLGIDRAAARRIVRAGAGIQANQVITLVPAWITPTLVAALLGPEAVGLLTWAASLGRKPLEVLENLVRVSLPHFARLQHDIDEVVRVLARYVVACLLVCGLWFAVLAVAGQDLVTLVYTERWVPAVPALLMFAGAGMLSVVRWLAAAALVGIGRIRFTTSVNTLGALVATVASALLVLRFGLIGVPLGQFASLMLTTPLLLSGFRRGASASLIREVAAVAVPIATSIVAGGLLMLLPLPPGMRAVLVAGMVSIVYATVTWWVAADWLRASVREEVAPVWIAFPLRGHRTKV
jgi:O-antigen/teichoic acid export membrane protein